MQPILHRCGGLDVHKATVMACVLVSEPGGKIRKEVRQFGTMTRDILELADWLASLGVTHVAMESTGVYWKPLFNLLEGRFKVMICNAQHIKQVPGRKTDVKDCEWIAQLLMHGLLRGSFVPAPPLRQLRDLTRQRTQWIGERTRAANRIHKVLEDGNIKLSSVASDILGVSGREMIKALIDGQNDPAVMADMARQRLRKKIPQLKTALSGRVSAHHRFLLRELYEHLLWLEGKIERFGLEIESVMASQTAPAAPRAIEAASLADDTAPDQPDADQPDPDPPGGAKPAALVSTHASSAKPSATQPTAASDSPNAPQPADQKGPVAFDKAMELLVGVPGIDTRIAQGLIAEIGTDMRQFPSSAHLCSWAGICSGNNQSAGKRKGGKTAKANRWLRGLLTQSGWAAGKTKNSYLGAQFRRLTRTRGEKRAIVAVAHSILVIVYHLLKTGKPYQELGRDYFEKLDPQRLTNDLVKRLQRLGHKVTLEPQPKAA